MKARMNALCKSQFARYALLYGGCFLTGWVLGYYMVGPIYWKIITKVMK